MTKQLKKIIALVCGTRPEALKLAPVYLALQESDGFTPIFIITGQHPATTKMVLEKMEICPDITLAQINYNGDLSVLTEGLLDQVKPTLIRLTPALVIVQGDTASAYIGALSALQSKIKIAHVEAGLRTHDLTQPFPEELYRRLIGKMADFHFAPTEINRKNLMDEGVRVDQIWVTGNTILDSLNRLKSFEYSDSISLLQAAEAKKKGTKIIISTIHRRENQTDDLESILHEIDQIAGRKNTIWYFIMHPNPQLQQRVKAKARHVELLPPQEYPTFVRWMQIADLIVTDSGGIQEEACAIGTPTIVIREKTERPEAIESGWVRLWTPNSIPLTEVIDLMMDTKGKKCPFGDGLAGRVIADHLIELKEFF